LDLTHRGFERSLKSALVRQPLHHESGQRLVGVEKEQPSSPHGLLRVNSGLLEMPDKVIVPFRTGDYQGPFPALQALTNVERYVSSQKLIVHAIELDQVSSLWLGFLKKLLP